MESAALDLLNEWMKAHNFTNESAITERIIVRRMMEYDLFPTPTLVAVTAVCSLLFLVGVPGNLCTVLVIARSTEMRTTTNYYLASLACADLLTFFILPLELYRLWCYWDWELGDAVCRGMYFLRETFTAASILHISGFTVERYIAICHPLQAKRLLRRGRVKVLVAAAWVLAVVPASPALLIFGVTRIQTPRGFVIPGMQECGVVNKELGSVMSLVSTSFFFVPMILLSLLYGLMAWALTDRGHRSRFYRGSTEQTEGSRRQDNNRRKVIRMLAVIVLTFVILWLPHHVSRVTFNHVRTWTTQLYQVHNIVTLLSFVLFYLSSAVNPIIYNMMSQRFRYALKHFLCGRGWLRGAQLSSKSSFRTRLSAISRGQSGSDGGGERTEKARDEPQMIAMVEIIGDNAGQCDL